MITVFSEPLGVRVFFSTARDVLQCTMMTHQILLRGAAQCYLLQTAMNLVDAVSWSFLLTLTSVRESFSVSGSSLQSLHSRPVLLPLEALFISLALGWHLEPGFQEGSHHPGTMPAGLMKTV